MNSCLYECDIMHYRLEPKKHKFTHRIFMFYFDLDEIDGLTKKITFLSHNRFNIYNFCDSDHISFKGESIKDNVLDYLKTKGVDLPSGKIMLLTNVRTFGYKFNQKNSSEHCSGVEKCA